ncbi:hypothetical protein RJT34_31096 [Clitoria ternatea]|uniref:Uncharacterized protein n=1 Tax=Clitoria ternatea TaxID=43366 RepID=A0AAN9EY26_CLITE
MSTANDELCGLSERAVLISSLHILLRFVMDANRGTSYKWEKVNLDFLEVVRMFWHDPKLDLDNRLNILKIDRDSLQMMCCARQNHVIDFPWVNLVNHYTPIEQKQGVEQLDVDDIIMRMKLESEHMFTDKDVDVILEKINGIVQRLVENDVYDEVT